MRRETIIDQGQFGLVFVPCTSYIVPCTSYPVLLTKYHILHPKHYLSTKNENLFPLHLIGGLNGLYFLSEKHHV